MESTPKDLYPYDDAYILKRQTEDENNWMQGKYNMIALATVLSQAFNKNSKMEYPSKPFMTQYVDEVEAERLNPEIHELQAMAEMQLLANAFKEMGMPKTIINDIECEEKANG